MKRQNLYLKLTPGVDDDLIQWLGLLPDGQRNSSVKALLREAIQQRTQNSPLVSIRSELAAIRNMLAQGITVQQPTTQIEAAPALSQAQLSERGRKLMKSEW